MSPFCPCCGYNLVADAVVEMDGFMLDPRGSARFGDAPLTMSAVEAMLLHTIGTADGRIVSRAVLAARIDCDTDSNVLDVHLTRIRNAIRAAGAQCPLLTIHGAGIAWRSPVPA